MILEHPVSLSDRADFYDCRSLLLACPRDRRLTSKVLLTKCAKAAKFETQRLQFPCKHCQSSVRQCLFTYLTKMDVNEKRIAQFQVSLTKCA